MLKIALLDDDKTALLISKGAIESFFQEKNIAISLDAFSSPINFLSMAKEENYRLVFLDIDMPELNGLEVGEQVKEINPQTDIIYLSQREDLVFDTLKLHPFGFIRKSKLIEDFSSMMNQFYNTMMTAESDESKIDIIDKTRTITFKINEIVYIEGDRNYQKVVLKDGSSQNIRIPLGSLEEKLYKHGFIRIHKGYLVNYLYIRSIGTDEVLLTSGSSLPMSKKRKEEIMKQYLDISRNNTSIIL